MFNILLAIIIVVIILHINLDFVGDSPIRCLEN